MGAITVLDLSEVGSRKVKRRATPITEIRWHVLALISVRGQAAPHLGSRSSRDLPHTTVDGLAAHAPLVPELPEVRIPRRVVFMSPTNDLRACSHARLFEMTRVHKGTCALCFSQHPGQPVH